MTVELACSQQSRNRHSLSFPVAYPLLNTCPVIAFIRRWVHQLVGKLYSRTIAFDLKPTYGMLTVISAFRMNSASKIDFPREN